MPYLLNKNEDLDTSVKDANLPQIQMLLNRSEMRDFFERSFLSDSTKKGRRLLESDLLMKRYRPPNTVLPEFGCGIFTIRRNDNEDHPNRRRSYEE